jgi:hypothetical protein
VKNDDPGSLAITILPQKGIGLVQNTFDVLKSPVPEMDGRPVAKYLIRATKSCSKLGSHWPNKKRLGDCLLDR